MNDIVLTTESGEVFTTSLLIAEKFGKRHDNLLQKIQSLPEDPFTRLNFKVSEYADESGKANKMYLLTRDGFSYLAMGFTGKEAHQWKVKFIEAFNKMEAHLKRILKKGWLEHRADAALETRQANRTLQEVRSLIGKETKFYHYANEAKLVNWALTGEFKPLDRDRLSEEDLRILTILTSYNAVLLGAGVDRDSRKTRLVERCRQHVIALEHAA